MFIIDKPSPSKVIDAKRLARNVCQKLQISNDDSLVYLIGSGNETSNEQAVVTWLWNQGFADAKSKASFELACKKLSQTLSDALNGADI